MVLISWVILYLITVGSCAFVCMRFDDKPSTDMLNVYLGVSMIPVINVVVTAFVLGQNFRESKEQKKCETCGSDCGQS